MSGLHQDPPQGAAAGLGDVPGVYPGPAPETSVPPLRPPARARASRPNPREPPGPRTTLPGRETTGTGALPQRPPTPKPQCRLPAASLTCRQLVSSRTCSLKYTTSLPDGTWSQSGLDARFSTCYQFPRRGVAPAQRDAGTVRTDRIPVRRLVSETFRACPEGVFIVSRRAQGRSQGAR